MPRFGLLGPLLIEGVARPIELPAPKLRVVLAALLLHADRGVTLEYLIDALWDDAPPASARVTVRGHVKRLRHALRPELSARLGTTPSGYRMSVRPGELDSQAFASAYRRGRELAEAEHWPGAARVLAESLALWRGEPLSDVASVALRRDEAPALTEQRLDAWERRITAELHLARHRELVPELLQLVTAYPLREALCASLMLALHRCGRTADALDVYRRARERLIDEIGMEPGFALSTLHRQILDDDPRLQSPALATPTASAGRAGVFQLPAGIDDLTGRDAVSDQACALARPAPDRHPLVVISGVGGVGKTALAVHVACRLRDAYPDGQLYLHLRGSGPAALSPGDALGQLLRGIDTSGSMPETVDERSARFRSLIAHRRLLILLDDARSAAQVRPLLAGTPNCAVIVTSRSRLVGLEAARRVDLEPLPPDAAQALVIRILGAGRAGSEQQAVRALTELCGNLPLALRIVAARLVSRPQWMVRDMVSRLGDRRQRLNELLADDLNVRATFELTYSALAPEQAQAFRLLAASDLTDLSVRACAALTDLLLGPAEMMAEGLVDLHLLESTRPRRYHMHDLVRLFALEKVEPDPSRPSAVDRLHHGYRSVLRSAAQFTRPGLVAADDGDPCRDFADADAARTWLDDEYPNVVTLIVEAAREAGSSVEVATEMLRDIQGRLRAGGHWPEWQLAAQAVLEAADRAEDRRAALTAHQHLGQLATLRGRLDDADDALHRALSLARDLHDQIAEASVLNRLGLLEFARSCAAAAIACHEEAYRISSAIGHPRGAYTALTNLAQCRIADNDPAGAIDSIRTGLTLAEQAGDEEAVTLLLHHNGNAQAALGRHDDAIRSHLRTLALIRRLGQREGEAHTLISLGRSYLATDQPDAAEQHLRDALAILEALGEGVTARYCLVELTRTLLQLNRPDQAEATLRRARAPLEPGDTSLRSEIEAVQAAVVAALAQHDRPGRA